MDTNDQGLFGYVSGATIKNVGLIGVDISGRDEIGGLAGEVRGNSRISYAHVTGNISGRDETGGLVGRADDSHISRSHATADVSGARGNTGGLIGGLYNNSTVSDSYAGGSVSSPGNTGGLVGRLVSSNRSLSRNYATGSVSGSGSGTRGGLVGSGDGSCTNSYWDTQTTGINSSACGTGQTTEQLQFPVTNTGIYASWSTLNWFFGTASQYPALHPAKVTIVPSNATVRADTAITIALGTPIREADNGILENADITPDLIALTESNNSAIAYEGSINEQTITLRPTALLSEGDYIVTLLGNKVKTIGGDTLKGDISANFTVDATPPQIISAKTNLAGDSVFIKMSEEVRNVDVAATDFSLSGASANPVISSLDDNG